MFAAGSLVRFPLSLYCHPAPAKRLLFLESYPGALHNELDEMLV
jgi:hypothetical protein